MLNPSRADIDAVFPRVAEIIADALAREVGELRLDSRLIEDLGAESIDFLDIVFQLEQGFGLRIPRGQILDDARGPLSHEEFQQDGVITDAGLTRLRAVLSEVPAAAIAAGLRIDDVAWLFTVETFCKVVLRAQAESRSG